MKRKMEKFQSKYVIAPTEKAKNNVIIIWKLKYYVDVLKCYLNLTSTYVSAQLTKDKPPENPNSLT